MCSQQQLLKKSKNSEIGSIAFENESSKFHMSGDKFYPLIFFRSELSEMTYGYYPPLIFPDFQQGGG